MDAPETPDEKATRYFLFYRSRNEGYSEAQLAAKFGRPSARDLYGVLNEDGFPVCIVCGGYSQGNRYCEDCLPSRPRLPRGNEESALDLPPAGKAVELFEAAIELLGQATRELPFMRQWLHKRRFVTEGVHPKESGRTSIFHRKRDFDLPPRVLEAHWRKLCVLYGQDPQVEEFTVPIPAVHPGGADWYPHDFLVWLVAVYAVTGKPLEDLLMVLHPDPNEEHARKANQKRDELLLRARQLAGLLRGSPEATKSGRKAESITPAEQDQARDLNDAELREEYEKMGMSKPEIDRLVKLHLPHTKLESD